jgi:predicted DNA-binding transcriptional regulator YafY
MATSFSKRLCDKAYESRKKVMTTEYDKPEPFAQSNEVDEDTTGRLKHESAERIFRLLQFLSANTCTRQDVFTHLASYYKMEEEEASDTLAQKRANRMFERDIRFLEEQGFEVQRERGGKGRPTRYSIVRGSGPRPTFLFTENEVDSLALLYNMFADPNRYAQFDPTQPLPQQPPRNPFADEMLKLLEKLTATLPRQQREQFERRVRKPYVYFNLSTVSDYLPYREVIETVVRAIAQRQQIAFQYKPTHRRQDTTDHEHIDPYYITYMDGHFYLIAFSHKMNDFLEYRIDRIIGETLKIQPDMIDTQRRRHPVEFRFWIDGQIAKRGLSQRWITQVEEREESYTDERGYQHRRVLVRATAYSEWRILQQILKYGDRAELVEPERLRERMKQVVQRMQKFYED